MKKVLVLLIVLVAAACVAGYFTFLKPRAEKKKAKPQLQSQAQESPEKKKAQLEEELRSIQRFAEDNPRDLREIERRVKEFEGKTTSSSFLAIHAQRILTEAKSNFDEQAKNASSNKREQAEKFLTKIQPEESTTDGRKKDYYKAIEIIDSFPTVFADTPYSAELRQLREQVKFYVDACDAWEKHRTDAGAAYHLNDLDKALKILNDFPEKYRTTEWEKKRQELLSKYQGEKQTAVAQQETEEKLLWHPLFSGESDLRKADWDPGRDESPFVAKDGMLTITCPPDQEWVSMSTGAGDWAEFVLEIDMRLVRGSILFSVRGTLTSGDEYRFDNIDVGTSDFESGGWRKVKLRVKDNRMIISTPGLRGSKENTCERKNGPIALFVAKDTEVQIKSIKIAFYGQEPDSWARRQATAEEKKSEEKKPEKGK